MKITFCINELDPGGAEKALVRIACGLHRRGHECRVVSLRDRGELAATLEAADIPVVVLGQPSRWSLAVIGKLQRELTAHPTDLLQCFLPQANFVGRIAGRRAGTPVVLSGIRVADRRAGMFLWLDRLTKRWVTKYVAVSRSVADFHAGRIGLAPESITAILNGVDTDALDAVAPASPVGSDAQSCGRVILFVGRLDRQKAPLDLLHAFELLRPDIRRTAKLVFVGDGPLRDEVQRQVRTRELTDSVSLPGYRAEAVAFMKAAACLVLPSHWEGLPNVALEAMAVGLPVVATAVDGITELIESGKTGLLVRPSEPAELARAITEMLTQHDRAAEMAAAAQRLVRTKFTWEMAVEQYESLYRHLVAREAVDPRAISGI